MEQLLDLTKTALEAKRQDDEALALYWQCIQSDTETGMLPEAYRLLYTAWSTQEKPDSLDALVKFACQRNLSNIEILDNKPFGIVDFLDKDDSISTRANWLNDICILATSADSIQTKIEGEKYLGMRVKLDTGYSYGWIRLNIYEYDDRINVQTMGYCYKRILDEGLKAGQKE